MIPLYLTTLTFVIDDQGNLGHGKNLQKVSIFEVCIFLNKLPTTNLTDGYR